MGAFFVAYHALVDNIVVGVLIALRITLLAWASILFVQTTNEATIGATLRSLLAPLNRLGVPTFNFISALVVALRFIPLFKEEATMLKAAQMARGAAFEGAGVRAALKAAIGLMVPLIVGVFKRVDALAEAMDARAYGATVEPTSLVNFKMKPADRGVLVGIVALFVVAMVA
jgi:energy-coupling factor transport system permease protein